MKHGSLFSGIGGFDLAAEWMGWENVFHCEWNEFGKKVLHHYWPQSISYHDITKTDFTIHRGRIDILTGGFPCQPYSSAGKRKGKEDERHLWPEMLRAIKEIQPRWVVGENVLGLVNWSGGLVFHEVQTDLEAAGYEVWPYVLPAASVGAPHRRDRVWFVAYVTGNGYDAESDQANNPIGQNNKQSRSQRKRTIEGLSNERSTSHPNRNGFNQRNGNDEINTSEGRFNALGNADKGNEYGDVADTEGKSSERMRPQFGEFSKSEQGEFGGTHSKMDNWDVADTDSQLCERGSNEDKSKTPKRHVGTSFQYNTWQNFPTQSPICTGNDGISSRLDGITFSKWRNESIKASGNAVVPQVVYQIFKAIHQYEALPTLEDTL
jgi:DNA (cytosine-5)-methyltransferase 1